MKSLCYVMTSMLLVLSCFQGVSEATYCDMQTYVFHGNGMFNSKRQASTNLKELQIVMSQSGNLSEQEWTFELSYNNNEGIASFFEVYRQSMGDQAASFWRWLGSRDLAPEWFQDAAQEVAATYSLAEGVIDNDLRDHVQRYQSLLMEGNRVLVVAHSQGNLYANAAYTNLASDSRIQMGAFGIVSVATPASYVAGNGSYFTLTNDLVIAAVRAAVPSVLPVNVANTNVDTDWKHHSFIKSYLNGNQTGPMIVNSALSQANSLSWPTPQIGSGPISVTLTWGAERDVDLHVNEPDGSHVYYGNMWGSSGYLDYDDVTSWGPEHYYVVDCENLATGRYGVGVNYYSGNGPETAHVQVQAGDIIRDYSINLSAPEGSAGNSNAEPVASIEVIGDAESGYEFTVAGAAR